MSSDDTTKNTLTDADIITDRPTGRRGFMGLMAVGGMAGAVTALTPRQVSAQGTDADNGALTDDGGCGRGGGGVSTGVTDADSGNITDASGWGRGAPYC
ncbi:MAG TPA: twin-arginine translocation signal domain-containing protein [Roseibacterium sp.]|nr:twin-arginine translocation signal domain-containing protein [Roseibacterium sp.]